MDGKQLLLVGALEGVAWEVCETAVSLGYSPLFALFAGQQSPPEFSFVFLDEIPGLKLDVQATVARAPRWKDLEKLRVDSFRRLRLQRQVRLAEEAGVLDWITLLHPTAWVSPSATLQPGIFVGPHASISSITTVGKHSRIGRGSQIGHHVTIGDFCHLGPGVVIPSEVSIGNGVTVGPGAVFLNGVQVEDDSLIGAGAVVTRNVKSGELVLGNPARPA